VSASLAEDPIRRWLLDRVGSGLFPGGAWWIGDDGEAVSRGAAGAASLVPAPEEASENTPYDLASLTKPLATALVAVMLEEEGRIDLDAPAVLWLQELDGTAYSGVSLLDLGAHRAGLPAWHPLYLEADTADGYVRRIAVLDPVAEAGAELYSDLGYLLLGKAVERAASCSLERLFQQKIAGPLGLEATGFARGAEKFGRAAATEWGNEYERSLAGGRGDSFGWRTEVIRGEVHDQNAHHVGGVAGHAGLFGTASEVAAVAGEILRPRLLALGPSGRERMLRPVAPGAGRTFGFATAAGSGAARGVLPDDAPGHTGFTGTSVWLDPGRGRCYVLLTNRVHPRATGSDFQPQRLEFHRLAAAIPAR
jgi:CubicO group peptidase (beta-lactamase class C family)